MNCRDCNPPQQVEVRTPRGTTYRLGLRRADPAFDDFEEDLMVTLNNEREIHDTHDVGPLTEVLGEEYTLVTALTKEKVEEWAGLTLGCDPSHLTAHRGAGWWWVYSDLPPNY